MINSSLIPSSTMFFLLHLIYTIGLSISLVLAILVITLVWLFHLGGISYSRFYFDNAEEKIEPVKTSPIERNVLFNEQESILSNRLINLFKFHRKPSHANVKELTGISIIKPLTGIDGNLYENLKTFFNLHYPRYEILFCIQEHDMELIDMVERLRAQYPRVESQIFVHSSKVSSTGDRTSQLLTGSKFSNNPYRETIDSLMGIKNPKIFNMLPAYEKAQYPLILISDSGLMMPEHALYDMALCMSDTVGLVHQMPFTCDRKGFAGSVEKVYFGTQHARMYMTINLIGINCVTGMSCLIRKECIDRVGGLRAFGDYIAEDYYIASEVARQGWKLRVATTPAQQNSGEYSVRFWTERMIRWCKLRMRLSPLAYLEPLQECFSSAILAGMVTNYLFEWNALVVAACHILIWFIFDYLMLRITQGGPLPFSKFEFAIAWLVRELSSFYIYFQAFTGSSTIKWRGKEYRLGSGTRAEEMPPLPSPPPAPSPVIDPSLLTSSAASTSPSPCSSSSSSLLSSPSSSSSTNPTLPNLGAHLLPSSSLSSSSTKQASQLV